MARERSWVECNLKTIISNYKCYKDSLKNDCEIMAVVKADAYGHGDQEVTRALYNRGVKYFAVSNIEEAIRVRDVADDAYILILGYTNMKRAHELIDNDIIQALLSKEYASKIVETNLPVRCQFAIDTGMRRIGLNTDDLDECEQIIREYADKLKLDGVFTHLCVADTPEQAGFTDKQIRLFDEVCNRVSDLKLPYCHCMNSAGGLWHNSKASCFARLGIVLYGLRPDYANTLPEGIEPALAWKSVVSMVKEVKSGDTIGYGRSFTVEHPLKIATIPTGYADGYPRLLSNKGWVLINGHKAPIVGRVCMDQMMVDVTDIPDVDYETEVVLIGKSGELEITADDLAETIGTIGYEIVCGISKRVERVYL